MQSIVSRRDFRKLKNAVFVGCRDKALPSARVGQINIGMRHGGAFCAVEAATVAGLGAVADRAAFGVAASAVVGLGAVSDGAVFDVETSPVAGLGAVSDGAVFGAEASAVAGLGAVSDGAVFGAEASPRTSGAELPGAKAVVFAPVSGAAFAAVLSADPYTSTTRRSGTASSEAE